VPFPRDYSDVVIQCRYAVNTALKDGKKLMEVEFPSGSLENKPGELDADIGLKRSAYYISKIINTFADNKSRVLFPDRNEEVRMTRKGEGPAKANPAVAIAAVAAAFVTGAVTAILSGGDAYDAVAAASTVAAVTRIVTASVEQNAAENSGPAYFAEADYRTGYLVTTLAALKDFGIGVDQKVSVRYPDDSLYVVAYPSVNVNELLAVQELYDELSMATSTPIITFNGEIDRIRSGYYGPAFLNPKLSRLNDELLPKLETVYYIRNFKGKQPGVLFRCYPGRWQVLRRTRGYAGVQEDSLDVVQEFKSMPTLKEVAEILASS